MSKKSAGLHAAPLARIGRGVRKFFRLRESVALVLLVIFAFLVYLINPRFLSAYNLQSLARQIAIFGFPAIAATLIIISAGIDLSFGSMIAFYGVIAGMLMESGFGVGTTVAAVLALGMMVGLYHGSMISIVKLSPFIVTLASLSIFRGIAVISTRGYPVRITEEGFLWIGQEFIFGIPVPFVLFILTTLVFHYLLNYTAFGKHLYAIGGNPEAAHLSGISHKKTIIMVYMIAGALTAFGAIIMASRLAQGMPGIARAYELRIIASAVIGGTSLYGGVGTVFGAVLGASLLALIENMLVLSRVDSWWNDVVIGVVIVIAVWVDVVATRRRLNVKLHGK